ncbi:hypothetical protein E3N88_39897 [Mikania micrantha]|uniref:Uncharacterized protein n=1 Tax=Mikania micrantha TaxID=192012 RepID=A0A5N6LL31_9ASTR|nr:hypothetical protein E3N88_39897 [Mikania micrantha]
MSSVLLGYNFDRSKSSSVLLYHHGNGISMLLQESHPGMYLGHLGLQLLLSPNSTPGHPDQAVVHPISAIKARVCIEVSQIKRYSNLKFLKIRRSEIILDFMNWNITAQSESYKQTIEAVESIETPAVGFSKASGMGTTTQQTGITIKQNNFIIQAVISLLEELKTVKEDIKELRQETRKGKAVAENEQFLEELNKKLEKLSIGGEKLHKPKGPYYVFKDPYRILKEEREKQKTK